jgi:hypothetical protein
MSAIGDSLVSCDSRHTPYLLSRGTFDGKSAAAGREEDGVEEQEQNKADRVNRVTAIAADVRRSN